MTTDAPHYDFIVLSRRSASCSWSGVGNRSAHSPMPQAFSIANILPCMLCPASLVRPVMVRPGRAKLSMKPLRTGSTPPTITIGIVDVEEHHGDRH